MGGYSAPPDSVVGFRGRGREGTEKGRVGDETAH